MFSYRFTEVISCGSIPAVYADNWLLPFGKDLINWTEAAVIIPEAETLDTVSILSKFSAEQRCRMRQKVYEMYRKYMETGRGVIRGIIENFELSFAGDMNRSSSMETSTVQEPVPEFAMLFNESALTLIYDRTAKWDSQIERLWLDSSGPAPPAMLVLTSFAWNHPNQTYGMNQYRGIRSGELYEGIVNHPWFHPTAWEDIQAGRMPISNVTRYYVFFDFETCRENNYPSYGHGPIANRDSKFGRGDDLGDVDLYLENLLSLTLFQLANVKGVVFECGGNGPNPKLKRFRGEFSARKQTFAYISESVRWFKSGPYDQGLPPP